LRNIKQQPPTVLQQYHSTNSLLIGFPDYWRTLTQFGIPLSENWVATSSTAPCPPELAHALSDLGLTHLIQIYGSSETGAIGWREHPEGAYTLLPHWQARWATAEQGNPIQTPPTHLIWQQPKQIESELRQPAAEERENQYPIPDKLQWQNERSFTIGARLDNAVQVGGLNVYPTHIAKLLTHIDGIDAATVRLMRPDEGTRLKAFVVSQIPRQEYHALQQRIDQFCTEHLQPMERPKDIQIGNALPKSSLGKLVDWPMTPPEELTPPEG
jgi:4-coumarate--CoA ligase (photoactive yellow protein activation family)